MKKWLGHHTIRVKIDLEKEETYQQLELEAHPWYLRLDGWVSYYSTISSNGSATYKYNTGETIHIKEIDLRVNDLKLYDSDGADVTLSINEARDLKSLIEYNINLTY